MRGVERLTVDLGPAREMVGMAEQHDAQGTGRAQRARAGEREGRGRSKGCAKESGWKKGRLLDAGV